jgi:3-hydroxyisobutyrate dehydrogenase-like beta-hydroxyacid dehydrogenase
MKNIGIIGLGLLGSAIAERMTAEGYEVVGYDVDPSKGGVASAAEVARSCRQVILSLPNSAVTARVLGEVGSELRAGAVILDTTTGAPADAERFAAMLGERSVSYLEANVGGSSEQVRQCEAIVIAGGDADVLERCAPLLNAFARRVFHAGPAGSGNRMKLVLNMVLGLNRAVLAEALGFAIANGIEPRKALEVLKDGPAYSRVMDTKGEKMIARDFRPQARLSQHLKDVRLMLAEGEQCAANLPFSRLHREVLEEMERSGFGGEDNSAVIRAFLPKEEHR